MMFPDNSLVLHMPGDCSNFATFHNRTDVNGDVISSWAEHVGKNSFRCKVCCSGHISFGRGMTSFNQHASGKVHKENIKKTDKYKKQLSISESLKKAEKEDESTSSLKTKVQNFEIDLIRRLDHHNITPDFLPCLVNCVKTHLADEDCLKIVDKVSIGKSKGRYIAQHGIAKTYKEETVIKLRNCDGFSIGFDESEMNKITELEIIVILSTKGVGIEMRHYRTLALEAGDAETITDTIKDQLDEDKIPWREKLIAPMTDGCPTMQGKHSGVKKRICDLAPQVVDFGSCNDHHLGNAARHGCSTLEVTEDYKDLSFVFMDVVYDLGGAPGKGNKRKLEFEKMAKEKGRKLKALHTYGSTRFKGYPICIEPILFNWDSLVEYYSQVTQPTPRQEKLIKVFVDAELDILMKLEFVIAATRDIMEAIAYFEQRDNKIHLARKKMESVLRNQLLKFIKKSEIQNLDEEGNVTDKTGNALLIIDVYDEKIWLSKNLVFVGQKCNALIRELGMTPSSTQLNDFYGNVYKFYSTMTSKLIGYFSIGLRSLELEYMEAFSPHNKRNVHTSDHILYLAGSFTKILKIIRPHDGFDKLQSEVNLYTTDPEVDGIDKKLSYNDYWLKVGQVTEGEWQVYEVLPRLALVLGTPFNSAAEMERGFSVQSDILRDPKRNRMSHDTLDTHMQIKYGMESKDTRDKCLKCNDSSSISCPCHCKIAEISDEMRSNCAQAWRATVSSSKEADIGEVNDEFSCVSPEFSVSFKKRIEKVKDALMKRDSLTKNSKVVPKRTTQAEAIENRRSRVEANNNPSKNNNRSKKKIPIRHTKDNDCDLIDEIDK